MIGGIIRYVSRSLRARAVRLSSLCLLGLAAAAGCAHGPWPDEPGVPVELARSQNVDAADLFLTVLTNRRRAANLPPPIVAARYQDEIRTVAEDLQAGKVSVAEAERAIERWARTAYQRDVKTFVVDCSLRETMPLPASLLEMPALVISYAAAHFRPRSSANVQCAVLATALAGSERVEGTKL